MTAISIQHNPVRVCVHGSLHRFEDISKVWFWVCYLLTLAHLVARSVCWSEVTDLADTLFRISSQFLSPCLYQEVDQNHPINLLVLQFS